jgi:hypothetical protein
VAADYWVQFGLTKSQKESVALAIFQDVSIKFEQFQYDNNEIVFWKTNSGFSEEDLPSDLILFYRVLKGYSQANIKKMCSLLTTAQSLAVWDETVHNIENRSFIPVFHPESATVKRCCPSGGTWPKQLTTIVPANIGGTWRNWRVEHLHVGYIGWISGTLPKPSPDVDEVVYVDDTQHGPRK